MAEKDEEVVQMGNEEGQERQGCMENRFAKRFCGCLVSWKAFKAWLLKWHLPLMLIFVVVFGYLVPVPGAAANDVDLGGICFGDICVWDSIGSLCVTLIFLISGLKLKTDAIKKAISEWKATLWGIIIILFISPCLSFGLARMQFGIKEFAFGLALFFAMPTTLSSGVALVGQAQGNVALALILTVITNVVGVFTSPIYVTKSMELYAETGSDGGEIVLSPVPMIVKLIFSILIPLIIGKLLRFSSAARKFAAKYSIELKVFSSMLLALIPWMKISSSADEFKNVDAASFVSMWLMGIAMHIVLLIINYVVSIWPLRLELSEKAAIVIICSQKTLPVAMTILDFLPEENVGVAGLVAIPIIVSHLMQILIDAVVASIFATKIQAQESQETSDTKTRPTSLHENQESSQTDEQDASQDEAILKA